LAAGNKTFDPYKHNPYTAKTGFAVHPSTAALSVVPSGSLPGASATPSCDADLLNDLVTHVLNACFDPDMARTAAEHVQAARLRRSGLDERGVTVAEPLHPHDVQRLRLHEAVLNSMWEVVGSTVNEMWMHFFESNIFECDVV
jgi:hypothetical protein